MRVFIIVIVVLVILLYTQYYYKYNLEYTIVQAYLQDFDGQLLYEKNPIVIYDQIYNIQELFETVLAYSYMFKKDVIVNTEIVTKCMHKYFIMWSDEGEAAVKLINPKFKNEIKGQIADSNVNYVTVKLKEKQVLIVPSLWYYYTENKNINAIGLDDLVSFLVYKVF